MTISNFDKFRIDPRVFDEDAIPQAVIRQNEEILDRLSRMPDIWTMSMPQIRSMRANGQGSFPLCPPDPGAKTLTIPGPAGRIDARVIRPVGRAERGTYLHLHGGGWIMGEPSESDARLRRLAENTGLATISVDYRLAPEHPYPAAPDDCEAAALWLTGDGAADFDTSFLAIGGESAGAHLCLVTMLRLRDRHGMTPFHAANLVAGCYDLGRTPSVRNWGDSRLILRTIDVETFCRLFLQNGEDTRDPDVSPLYAGLGGLAPALFTCGTKDLLIDDTLFLAMRWVAAGNTAETGIYPGGCHVFQGFPSQQAETSLSQMEAFLNSRIAEFCK